MVKKSITSRTVKTILTILATVSVIATTHLHAEHLPLGFDKNSVQFIFTKTGTNYVPAGTCFSVSVPVNFKMPWWKHVANHVLPFGGTIGVNFPYMVTAKHVLMDSNDHVRPDLYWRVNKMGGGVDYASLTEGPNNHIRLLTNADKSVDIAVFTISAQDIPIVVRDFQQKTNVHNTRSGAITSKVLNDKHYFDSHPVREGDEMFFVGLFTPFYGAEANIPICRFGRISMVTTEKIPFADTYGQIVPQDLYVAETQVFGGNSGSPAFIFKNNKRPAVLTLGPPNQLQNDVYFAGVVKGYFNDWSQIKVVNSGTTAVAPNNVGVAVLVPGYHLYEIIFSDNEKKFRADFEKLFHTKK